MVQVVNGLQALPKQQFTIVLDNVLWDITLTEAAGVMAATIKSGGNVTPICSGERCVAGELIIPKVREAGGGNFLFLTANDDLPWWEEFGLTQLLFYVSAAEIAAVRNGN
jgi:hypothetical protein